jgi:hypothetical protein
VAVVTYDKPLVWDINDSKKVLTRWHLKIPNFLSARIFHRCQTHIHDHGRESGSRVGLLLTPWAFHYALSRCARQRSSDRDCVVLGAAAIRFEPTPPRNDAGNFPTVHSRHRRPAVT